MHFYSLEEQGRNYSFIPSTNQLGNNVGKTEELGINKENVLTDLREDFITFPSTFTKSNFIINTPNSEIRYLIKIPLF